MWRQVRQLLSWLASLLDPGEAKGSSAKHGPLEQTLTAYPWYETVRDASIEQGDLLRGFQVVIPTQSPDHDTDEVHVDIKTYDVVVMTQTCDIEHGKVESLLLCPWWDLWQFIETAKTRGQTQWGSEQREALRRGNLPGYHLINEASQDGIEIGLGIVDFHTVYTAPTDQVREFVAKAGPRLRLRPPYKEHLAPRLPDASCAWVCRLIFPRRN